MSTVKLLVGEGVWSRAHEAERSGGWGAKTSTNITNGLVDPGPLFCRALEPLVEFLEDADRPHQEGRLEQLHAGEDAAAAGALVEACRTKKNNKSKK